MDRGEFISRVLEEIKFRPDHKAIRQELLEHIEDETGWLCGQGMSKNEAEAQAVLSMGEPEAIGRELNQVHRPLIGWAWQLSRAALIVAAVVVIISAVLFFKGNGQPCIYQSNGNDIMTYEDAAASGNLDTQKELDGESIVIGDTVLNFKSIATIKIDASFDDRSVVYLEMKPEGGEFRMNSAFVTEGFFDDRGKAMAKDGYMFYQRQDGAICVAFKNADTETEYIDVVYDMFGIHSECRLDRLQR